MKILSNNVLLRTLICLLFTLLTPSLYTYSLSYRQKCAAITLTQKMNYIIQIIYYRFTHSTDKLYQALSTLGEEIKNYENELLEREQKILTQIKEKYSIEENIWHTCLSDIEKIKNIYTENTQKIHSQTIWDLAVPADIKNCLITLLEENNIEPTSINVALATQELADSQPGHLAYTEFNMYTHKKFRNGYEYIPTTITIFPSLLEQSFEEKMSICAHEVQHIALQHSITKLVLIEYLSDYYSINAEDLKQSKEILQLDIIHEAQAETIAAIKNPVVSHSLEWFRSQHYYPNYLYEEHFHILAAIDTLWKIHNKLEYIYFTKGLK